MLEDIWTDRLLFVFFFPKTYTAFINNSQNNSSELIADYEYFVNYWTRLSGIHGMLLKQTLQQVWLKLPNSVKKTQRKILNYKQRIYGIKFIQINLFYALLTLNILPKKWFDSDKNMVSAVNLFCDK